MIKLNNVYERCYGLIFQKIIVRSELPLISILPSGEKDNCEVASYTATG